MEYRVNVGTGRYRHFIVEAADEQQARRRFDEESKSDYGKLYTTHGFTLKDVTSVVKAEPEPDWGLVKRACDAVYHRQEAEFLKAETIS